VDHWSATHPDAYATDIILLKKFAGLLGRASSSVFNPKGLATTATSEYLVQLQKAGLLFKVDHESTKAAADSVLQRSFFDDAYNKTYEIHGHTLFNSWQDQINDAQPSSFWRFGWSSVLQDSKLIPLIGYGFTPIEFGEKAIQWVEENKSYNFLKYDQIKKVHKTELIGGTRINPRTGDPIPTCFIPGTSVLTAAGPVNIESLREHDSVLTRAEPQQWGVRSSETVRLPAPEYVYGFNKEGAFFTAGHPFHTKTGLRALDPEAARRENPWLEVGTLEPGHILLRTTDGKTYEEIQIESVEKERCEHEYVYGVHLREGLRSYHANGYLVALNYPEITVASVAKDLLTFPPEQRLQLLAGLREISPLLKRFGGKTVLSLLEQESQLPVTQYGGKPRATTDVLARDLYKSYVAYDRDASVPLAQVEVYAGVLRLDGEHCEHASFKKNTVFWSRMLRDGRWEHAWCKFKSSGIGGFGRIFRSAALSPTEKEILKGLQRFYLVPGKPKQREEQDQTEDCTSPLDAVLETAQWTIKQPVFAERVANSSVDIDSTPQMSFLPTKADNDLNSTSDQRMQFKLAYDPKDYNTETDEKTWAPSVPLFTTSCAIQNYAAEYSTLVVDPYVKIRDAVVSHAKGEVTDEKSRKVLDEFPALFEVYQTTDWQNRTVFEFESVHGARILQVSDQYQSYVEEHGQKDDVEWDKVPMQDLTFTNIGMDPSFVLPFIFAKMRLRLNALGTNVEGVVTRYDPLCPDFSGTPHWFNGTVEELEMADVSNVMLSVPPPSDSPAWGFAERTVFEAHAAPHFLARRLAENTWEDDDEKVTALMAIPYRQRDINEAVQRMIANIMSYHLEDSTRETFFGTKEKPKIPHEYADDLDKTTKHWLKDTYGPVYICSVLSNQEGVIAQERRFDGPQKKRIKYFWEGKGADCLSRSKIFHALERSVTRYQIRQYYKDVGDAYKRPEKAVELSNKLLKTATSVMNLERFGREKSEEVGKC
jgi:hypothetical protein